MPRPSFLVWFSVRDLIRAGAWQSSLACILTLFVGIFAILLTLGTMRGRDLYKDWETKHNLSATAMWIRPGKNAVRADIRDAGRFLPAELEQLRNRLVATLGEERLKAIHDFREIHNFPEWVTTRNTLHSPWGRTYTPDDAICADYVSAGVCDLDRTIVVTRKLLFDLGYENAIPATIRLKCSSNSRVDASIVVVDRPLPLGHPFMFPRKWYEELEQMHRPYKAPEVRTGIVPDRWPDPTAPGLQRIVEEFNNEGVRIRKAGYGKRVWQLSAGSKLSATQWESLVLALEAKVAAATGVSAPQFTEFEPVAVEFLESTTTKQPDHVGVFTKSTDDFDEVAEICKSLNLAYDESVVTQMQALGERARESLLLSLGLVAGVFTFAIVNLLVVQHLISRQKRQAVGMLMAIGMRRTSLTFVFLCESFLIWLIAATLAIPAVGFCGPALSRILVLPVAETAPIPPRPVDLDHASLPQGASMLATNSAAAAYSGPTFDIPLVDGAQVVLGALLMSVFVVIFVTWRLQRLSPAAALNAQG